jgi:hypothetical protein
MLKAHGVAAALGSKWHNHRVELSAVPAACINIIARDAQPADRSLINPA